MGGENCWVPGCGLSRDTPNMYLLETTRYYSPIGCKMAKRRRGNGTAVQRGAPGVSNTFSKWKHFHMREKLYKESEIVCDANLETARKDASNGACDTSAPPTTCNTTCRIGAERVR